SIRGLWISDSPNWPSLIATSAVSVYVVVKSIVKGWDPRTSEDCRESHAKMNYKKSRPPLHHSQKAFRRLLRENLLTMLELPKAKLAWHASAEPGGSGECQA